MKTSDFYYDLPQELIAQDPLEDRSSSRLMHLSLKDGSIEHRHFTDILDYLHQILPVRFPEDLHPPEEAVPDRSRF